MAWCPARPALYDRLTRPGQPPVRGGALRSRPSTDRTDAIGEAAARFGIADALGQRVGGYSTGMRARLALARAVLHDPDLLLLDEPTAGLDPESARTVLGLIDEMADEGKTVLMCTHLLLEAEGLADQVIVMDHGRAIVAGSPAELSHRYWPAARVILDADDPSVLDAARDLPFVPAYERNGTVTVDLDHETDVPDLVDALVRAGARLKRVRAARRRASRSSTSRSGSRNGEPHSAAVAGVGRSRAPTSSSSCRRATSGCRSRSSRCSSS